MSTQNETSQGEPNTEQQGEPKPGADQQDPKAAKVEAERLAAEAKQTEADADREAEIEKRAAAKAQKLAAKLTADAIAAKDVETRTKAEREKMDAVQKAQLEAKESADKLAAAEARIAAAELKGAISDQLVSKDMRPANAAAIGYIQAAVSRELEAGAEDVEKALARVHKAEPFLFAQPQQAAPGQSTAAPKTNTEGKAAGGTERPAAEQGTSGARQYQTKPPGELDATNLSELNRAVQERYGFTLAN